MAELTSIEKAKKLAVLLSICQDLMDDSTEDKMFFRQKLKYTSKNFSKELESFIEDLYKNMDNSVQIEYHSLINKMYEELELRKTA